MSVPANDTIVAISTPPGRGGIGIVRLSGPEAVAIATPMLRLRNPLAHAQARLAEILDTTTDDSRADDGADAATATRPDRLDEAVVTLFAAPNSYTGEDVLEIAAHGSPVVLEYLVRQSLVGGARLAEPGEFTQRAFLSGRIDLTQAEAVRDLIDAQTLHQARVAAQQMGGSLALRIHPVKQMLVDLIALLEAGIDFAEDDIDVAPDALILQRLEAMRLPLQALAASFAYGRIVHHGLTLAIVGRPNVGKSSLFNRLIERDRAIVTAAPGTTRDLVTERVSLEGIPVELVDTAGLRDAADEAEGIGILRSHEAMAEADIVLLVMDAMQPPHAEESALLASLDGRSAIVVLNKADLLAGEDRADKVQMEWPGALQTAAFRTSALRTSARTGEGIAALRKRIIATVQQGAGGNEPGMLTNLRQQRAVLASLHGLESAAQAVATHTPHEMLLLDIYAALSALDSLTGATTADDILNLIFSSFCIGK